MCWRKHHQKSPACHILLASDYDILNQLCISPRPENPATDVWTMDIVVVFDFPAVLAFNVGLHMHQTKILRPTEVCERIGSSQDTISV